MRERVKSLHEPLSSVCRNRAAGKSSAFFVQRFFGKQNLENIYLGVRILDFRRHEPPVCRCVCSSLRALLVLYMCTYIYIYIYTYTYIGRVG
jgi:hypothetical protein